MRKRSIAQFQEAKDQIISEDNQVKLIVKASDRLIESQFVGINPPNRRPRPDKEHLRFPLYTDKEVGFDATEEEY